MTNRTLPDAKVSQYRKLLGLNENSDLGTLNVKYAELQARFKAQIESDDPVQENKGRNNLMLLDQAYSILASDIRSRQLESRQRPQQKAPPGATRMSIELCSMRVGFQVIEGSLFTLETRKVNVNLFGMRASRTNSRMSTNWPSGKLTVFNDQLRLSCLLGSYEIRVNDIVDITKVWYMPFHLVIRQKSDDDMIIYVFGYGLGKKLRELASRFDCQVKLNY